MDPALLHYALQAAEESGVRLEMVEGVPVWEAFPGTRHQIALKRIEPTVRPSEGENRRACHAYQNILIRLKDGSFKRPDLSIFCDPLPEVDEAIELVPGAVVEVLSPGYERKDEDFGAPFYLKVGVLDVVLYDPRTGEVTHMTAMGKQKHLSPVILALQMGCSVAF